MFPTDLLRRLRNDLPMAVTTAALGRDDPPWKIRDGRFCILCPHCDEMLAYATTSPTASCARRTSTTLS
jgi:hypothetical protein